MKLEDVKKAGVVGSGLMGHGIGFSFALAGYPTVMSDLTDEILEDAMKKIRLTADMFVEEGLITRQRAEETISRISMTLDLEQVAANSDFITEAIDERLEDKIELFKQLDEICPQQTIIASNTSSLVMSDIGSKVKRQDKIVLTHYFSPPAYVPGVEVAKGPGTSDETFDLTYDIMKRTNHIPVRILKEGPGYLLNRLQHVLNAEAMRVWAEGVASAEDIDLGVRTAFGFRMPNEGPFLRYDFGGIWRWPPDVLAGIANREVVGRTDLSEEQAEMIRERYTEGKPWFVDPETFDEACAAMYRNYARRLKDMYWSTEKQAIDPEAGS